MLVENDARSATDFVRLRWGAVGVGAWVVTAGVAVVGIRVVGEVVVPRGVTVVEETGEIGEDDGRTVVAVGFIVVGFIVVGVLEVVDVVGMEVGLNVVDVGLVVDVGFAVEDGEFVVGGAVVEVIGTTVVIGAAVLVVDEGDVVGRGDGATVDVSRFDAVDVVVLLPA